ncbi:hemin uptake protein HemP [Azonexus sp.]|uniref:hemin uptake protein HemP n=1 Tax=Azonexus sp. TaxID=1872668 RepID=UPI0039E6A841
MPSHSPLPTPASSAAPPAALPRFDSTELLKGATTVEIQHAGQRYLLRVTRENKLILTK